MDFIKRQTASFDPPTPKSGENPSLEPNMEWIGCTACEIFAFKLYCDLETSSGSLEVIAIDTIR